MSERANEAWREPLGRHPGTSAEWLVRHPARLVSEVASEGGPAGRCSVLVRRFARRAISDPGEPAATSRDDGIIVRDDERAEGLEPDARVAVVVGRVRRLEVDRHPLGVDPGEVIGEQAHADPVASNVGMGVQQAQVVVRLLARVRRLEPVERLHEGVGPGTKARRHEPGPGFLLLLRHLRPAGWDLGARRK